MPCDGNIGYNVYKKYTIRSYKHEKRGPKLYTYLKMNKIKCPISSNWPMHIIWRTIYESYYTSITK